MLLELCFGRDVLRHLGGLILELAKVQGETEDVLLSCIIGVSPCMSSHLLYFVPWHPLDATLCSDFPYFPSKAGAFLLFGIQLLRSRGRSSFFPIEALSA